MHALGYIYWHVNPEILRLGPLVFRWYGLLFGLLFMLGWLIARWQFRIEHKDESSLDVLLVYTVVGTIVGARLGHCLFYDPVYYFHHPLEIPQVWRGGLASHGGAAGVLIALYLYSRKRPDQPYLWLLDRVAVPTALAGAMIRLGNLFNSEILGLPTHVPWAFVFERVDPLPRHPVQLYESLSYLLIFVLLLRIYLRWRERTPPGLLLGMFMVTVFTVRFLLEFLKERQEAYVTNLPLTVGQMLSIPFIALGVYLLWRAKGSKLASNGSLPIPAASHSEKKASEYRKPPEPPPPQ